MIKQEIFRDYGEQQAVDHNNLQAHVRLTFDHVSRDAITASAKYAGFGAVKTNQVELTVAPGRFYAPDGGIYARATSLVQNMTSQLAQASKRIIVLAVNGQEVETNLQERDFVTNVDTLQTEPQTVAMTRSRDALLTFWPGGESPDPQVPPIPPGYAAVAHILVDTLQIVSVTMRPEYEVESTESLDHRAGVLETDVAAIKPKVSALDAQLAELANRINALGDGDDLLNIMQDMATVKETIGLPDDSSNYHADHFLDLGSTDAENTLLLANDAKVEEGVRFAAANENISEIQVFSANDPNASLTNGLLLPAFTNEVKLSVGPYHSDLGIGQFGYQTVEVVKREMSRTRTRYGAPFKVSTSGRWWKSGKYDREAGIFTRKNGDTFAVGNKKKNRHNQKFVRLKNVYTDTYTEAYWDYVVTEHEAVGAHVSQTVPVATDFWLTRVGFWLAAKGANEAVTLIISEATNGVPDLANAILVQTIPHTSLTTGWTRVTVNPTFLEAGKRYAVSLISNANHKIGMAQGQSFVDGTFFTSTDGVYHQGDLQKDMLLELWGAKFNAPQVVIEFDALNLDGGIRAIDILADAVVPESTQLVWEIQPGAAGNWRALTVDDTEALAAAPPLCRFRARFVGTRDVMPGLKLTGSEVHVSRPKLTFKHISLPLELDAPSDDIYVRCLLEEYQETPHDFVLKLRHGASFATVETADVISDKALPDLPEISGRIERTFRFQLTSPISEFVLQAEGTTNSAATVFVFSDRLDWELAA